MAMQCFINQKPLNESIPWSDFCKPYQPKTIANKHHRKYYQTKAIAKNIITNIVNQKQSAIAMKILSTKSNCKNKHYLNHYQQKHLQKARRYLNSSNQISFIEFTLWKLCIRFQFCQYEKSEWSPSDMRQHMQVSEFIQSDKL